MKAKILFLKQGNFSNINNAVYELLKFQFPNNDIEVVDVKLLLKKNIKLSHYAINFYHFFKEYGLQILRGKKEWRKSHVWYFATSYLSLLISYKIQKLYGQEKFLFTFQTQSTFNGKLKDTPNFVYTDHTTRTNLLYPDLNSHNYMRSEAFIKKSEKKIYEDASKIFTFGNLVKKSLITQYNISDAKTVTVYAGSNFFQNTNAFVKKRFKNNILFVGMDWERKGGKILLKIFEQVLIKHPDTTLTVVGCSPKNISLPNCNIVGKVPSYKVAEHYNAATLFCLPTLREPFGMVFLEAMSFKLPIIANNIGCIPDLVINDYNGYLIDNNIKIYAEIICKLFDNPQKCRELGENGYYYAKNNFTWGKVGKIIKKEIDSTLLLNNELNNEYFQDNIQGLNPFKAAVNNYKPI